MSPCVAISAQRWETEAYRDQTRSVDGWAGFVRFGFTVHYRFMPGVDRQAGERVGAVNVPRLDSLRPEIPTAREFFGFDGIQNYGAVFGADAPRYGAVFADFPRIYGVFYGAAAGAKHRKEAFH